MPTSSLTTPTQAVPSHSRASRQRIRRAIAVAVLGSLALTLSTVGSTFAYLSLPSATGPAAVGRAVAVWVDDSRPEPRTGDVSDHRRVRIVAWYPAVAGSGAPGAYVPDVERIHEALVASGAIGPLEAAGLRAVRSGVLDGATPANADEPWPVLLLSPGNATNVDFYTGLATDLASRGYVVLGLDHPGQSAAVAVSDRDVIGYDGDVPLSEARRVTAERIGERVTDLRFVLDRLATDELADTPLRGRVDPSNVAVLGHSNGGLAAVEACRADVRVRACLNIDGQNQGGPFGLDPGPVAPDQPFLYLTKETELTAPLADVFERGGEGTYRVVIPAATHDAFTDGPRFRPRVLPLDGDADGVTRVTRGFTAAFFDHVLRGAPQTVLGEVDAPLDVRVEVFPLRHGAGAMGADL